MYYYEKGEWGPFPANLLRGMHPNKQIIVAWLIYRTNMEGACWPSVERLCRDTGIKSRTTLTSYLKELEAEGFLQIIPRKREDGGSSSNEYRVFIRRQGGGQQMDTNQSKENQKKRTSREGGKQNQSKASAKPQKAKEPPRRDEVVAYAEKWAKDHGVSAAPLIKWAEEGWRYYDRLEWHDSRGKPIVSWKHKFVAVWFKDKDDAPKRGADGMSLDLR